MEKNRRIEEWIQGCETPAAPTLKRCLSDDFHVAITRNKRRMLDNDKNSRSCRISARRHSLAHPEEYNKRKHAYRFRRLNSVPPPKRCQADIPALVSQIPGSRGYDNTKSNAVTHRENQPNISPAHSPPHNLAQPELQSPIVPYTYSVNFDKMPRSSRTSSTSDFGVELSINSTKRPSSTDGSNTTKKSKFAGLSTRKLRASIEQLPIDTEGFTIPGSATLHFAQPPMLRPIPGRILEVIRYFSSNNLIVSCIPETLKPILKSEYPYHIFHDFQFSSEIVNGPNLWELVKRWVRSTSRLMHHNRDEAEWNYTIREILSYSPDGESSGFAVEDVTTRPIHNGRLYSELPNGRIDHALTLNSSTSPYMEMLEEIKPILRRNRALLNPFDDSFLQGTIVVLGVEVKCPLGNGLADAETQLGIYSVKAGAVYDKLSASTDSDIPPILGVTVLGPTWSFHVTYRHDSTAYACLGPYEIGNSNEVVGVFKIIKFLRLVEAWSLDNVVPWCYQRAKELSKTQPD